MIQADAFISEIRRVFPKKKKKEKGKEINGFFPLS